MTKKTLYENAGHHKRLKEAIFKNSSFATETHILEAILTYLYIRKDTKSIAKNILNNSSLRTVFIQKNFTKYSKSLQEYLSYISEIKEVFLATLPQKENDPLHLKNKETLFNDMPTTTTINTPHDVILYAESHIKFSHTMAFWIIVLNTEREIVEKFSFNFTNKSLRKTLLKITLEKNSTYIVFLEKKDSKSYAPTKKDIQFLAQYKNDFSIFNIILLDYIIFTNTGSISLEKYNIHPL